MISASFLATGSVNAGLQVLTLLSKSILVIGLARYLSPEEFGLFGIFVLVINLSLYGVGLEFHAYNTREILKSRPEDVPLLIRDQIVFHLLTYAVVFPGLLLVFSGGLLPWTLAASFFALLVFEHLGQEIHRILITIDRSVRATVLIFVRGGLWGYLILPLMSGDMRLRHIDAVIYAWLLGAVFSVAVGAVWLRDLPWAKLGGTRVQWGWIRKGLVTSIPFLVASLAFRGIMSADRLALLQYRGPVAVGVFTFYVGARNAIQAILDMGIVAILRPRAVSAYQSRNRISYGATMRHMMVSVCVVSVSLCVLAALAIYPILTLVPRPEYGQHLQAFWILLLVTTVAALGEVPHTALYARHADASIVKGSVAGLCAAIVANVVLVPVYGLTGAALATLAGVAVMVGTKTMLVRGHDR